IEPEPEPEPEQQAEAPELAGIEATESRTGEGDAGEESGRESGTGAGAGGTEAEGRETGVIPPTPRGLILPPSDRPRSVRGKEVTVWVFVSAQGRVTPDSTRLIPSSGDRGFDQRLRQLASEWVFTPARRGGSAVAEWFSYVLVL
ncbi:MAG: energy transducer TonB, partial [Longimicrobiales bacterium]